MKKRTPNEAIAQSQKYFKNAKETLKKSPIEYDIYKDGKCVKEACAMAYLAMLYSIDAFLLSKGTYWTKLPTSIREYEEVVRKIPHNGKLRASLTIVYENLHVLGYYRGGVNVDMIKAGLKHAKIIIDIFASLI